MCSPFLPLLINGRRPSKVGCLTPRDVQIVRYKPAKRFFDGQMSEKGDLLVFGCHRHSAKLFIADFGIFARTKLPSSL